MAMGRFTWIETHRDIVRIIRQHRSNQSYLIEVLQRAGVESLIDRFSKDGPNEPLREIDPFSFFCMVYKYGSKRRLVILQNIARELDIAVPQDEDGIPKVNAQQAFMFPFAYERHGDEINRLWDFFEALLSKAVTGEIFADALAVPYTGPAKLTEGLFNIAPETYLPINGPVKEYLQTVHNIDPSFATWTEYLALLDRVRATVAMPFHELSFAAWTWGKAQREQSSGMDDGDSDCSYWVFQSNPSQYDVVKALADDTLQDWTVSSHRERMKVGDKVILYVGGARKGVYGLAEVTSEPRPRDYARDTAFRGSEDIEYKVDIRVTHDVSQRPIPRSVLATVSELARFKGGNQGTNFRSNQSEYDAILRLVEEAPAQNYWLYAPGKQASKWDEFFHDGIMAIGWNELGDLRQYSSQADVEGQLGQEVGEERRRYNDSRACFDFASVLKEGDIVIAKKGKWEYVGWGIVTSNYRYDPTQSAYHHIRSVDWRARGSWTETEHAIVLKTLTNITKYNDYVNRLRDLLGINVQPTRSERTSMNPHTGSINTILFGPPGTGKTYTTVNKALAIIDQTFMSSNPSRNSMKQRFDELINAQQICFTTFHQSLSYEDFIEGIKPTNTSDGGSLSYEVRDGVFKNFCELARSNWEASQQQRSGQLSFEAAWEKFMEEWEENPDVGIATHRTIFTVHDVRNKTIAFRKAGGSLAHTLSMNTLRDFYYDARPMTSSGLKTYYRGLLDKLQSYRGVEQSTQLKNYVFIIDEINRGNVSQIFGELITLIEDSKRLGADEHLTAVLPYSADEFGVPPNLYILGTMNTADRSVEALDTALRRRFSFEEMQPVYDLPQLQRELHGVRVADVLSTINRRIEKLLDRDHCIGHSYFLEAALDLRHVFQNKIIPLLQEYFFGDYGKIGLVLGRGFVEVVETSNSNHVFADFDYDQAFDLADRRVYRLATPQSMSDNQFAHALRSLIGV